MKGLDQKTLEFKARDEDFLLPFQIEGGSFRGSLVRLGPSITSILARHAYPDPVASLLAKTTALAATLGAAMKFDGVFTLQALGDGPVSMLVVDVTSDGALRACAKFDQEALAQRNAGDVLLGEGRLVFTVDQKLGAERYQGVVALEGDRLTEAFRLYFKRSEQIPTGLLAAAAKAADGRWEAGCLLVQRMPREGGQGLPVPETSVEDDWSRAMILMQSCSSEELTDPALAPEDLLYRLFHEEGVRVYDKKTFREECRCSKEKLLGVLRSLPEKERDALLVKERVEATCDFCGRTYVFTQKELSGA